MTGFDQNLADALEDRPTIPVLSSTRSGRAVSIDAVNYETLAEAARRYQSLSPDLEKLRMASEKAVSTGDWLQINDMICLPCGEPKAEFFLLAASFAGKLVDHE